MLRHHENAYKSFRLKNIILSRHVVPFSTAHRILTRYPFSTVVTKAALTALYESVFFTMTGFCYTFYITYVVVGKITLRCHHNTGYTEYYNVVRRFYRHLVYCPVFAVAADKLIILYVYIRLTTAGVYVASVYVVPS